jgi:hypothetical protein
LRTVAYSRVLVLSESFAGSCTILRLHAVASEIHSRLVYSPCYARATEARRHAPLSKPPGFCLGLPLGLQERRKIKESLGTVLRSLFCTRRPFLPFVHR